MSEHTDDDTELANPPEVKIELPKVEPSKPAMIKTSNAVIASPQAQRSVMAIMPRTLDEAWRMADAFIAADMVPSSLAVKSDSKATKARVMLAICKGAEVGLGPVSAIQTIMVINNKPCIYGDGAVALVQNSGVVEYIKKEITGEKWEEGYKVTITLKRKDQSEPYVRSFSYEDAKRARLIGKVGPWTEYPERQCYWRAWSWAARDGANDALMGLGLAEEVNDYLTRSAEPEKADTSDLNAGLTE